jgi:(p)ppGpp synthase/HD superfamily hydrolase
MNILDQALNFAACAHQTQKRKGSGIPYIVHPVGVMLLLWQAGETDPEVLAAALLHDTVEDTGATLDQLRETFGARIAAIVQGCSEPDKRAGWEARKQHTVAFIKTAPYAVLLVTVADKLHNLRSLMDDHHSQGEALWTRFKRGRAETEWYYRAIVDSLKAGELNGHPLLVELEQGVLSFFGPEAAQRPTAGPLSS